MKSLLASAGLLALSANAVAAGGVERSTQSVAILFEQGRYFEFSLGHVNPKVTGTGPSVLGGTTDSGDMTSSYTTLSFGLKMPINDRIDVALIIDEPIGANVAYPTDTLYAARGATGDIESVAATGIVNYRFNPNLSVHGGLRVQQTKGEVSLPFVGGYTMSTNRDVRMGYLLGVAYEIPEYAARVSLTYNSKITHKFDADEDFVGGAFQTSFDTTVPESVNLEFQTGIAADTLLFGSVRWVHWQQFDINPDVYATLTPIPLVSYRRNTTTWNLGVGRRFTENWSGAVTVGYEGTGQSPTGNLGPTDGQRSIGLAGTYTQGNMRITGGVRYIDLGDATTTGLGGNFTDNSAIAAGLRVGFNF